MTYRNTGLPKQVQVVLIQMLVLESNSRPALKKRVLDMVIYSLSPGAQMSEPALWKVSDVALYLGLPQSSIYKMTAPKSRFDPSCPNRR